MASGILTGFQNTAFEVLSLPKIPVLSVFLMLCHYRGLPIDNIFISATSPLYFKAPQPMALRLHKRLMRLILSVLLNCA
jgi:hypothetical protein